MFDAVKVNAISKSFGAVRAVDDVSFEVRPGEVFGLLGPNGAGKTTAIRVMMGIFRADSGSVDLFGGPLSESIKDRIGYLPEERGLYQDQRLDKILIYLATLKSVSDDDARRRLSSWLERFDLLEHQHKKVRELSKGMQQKAQLIATLLHEPELIVIDEPFSGLDPVNTRLVKDVIEELRRDGRTIIMSTHQMHQVEALCNRIVLIDRGRRVLYGAVDEIKRSASGNAVSVSGHGPLQTPKGVLSARQHNSSWQLTLAPGTVPQDVLREIMTQQDFDVERFQIAGPSLEDIFVSVVREQGRPSAQPADSEAADA